MTTHFTDAQFFKGLRALLESAFPKRCANCGRIYQSEEDFLTQTQHISAEKSGLKSSIDDDGTIIVEAFRNCICGSTLMDFFSDRRDLSANGLARREKFDALIKYLLEQGLEFEVARSELLKVLRGGKSEILKQFRPPT